MKNKRHSKNCKGIGDPHKINKPLIVRNRNDTKSFVNKVLVLLNKSNQNIKSNLKSRSKKTFVANKVKAFETVQHSYAKHKNWKIDSFDKIANIIREQRKRLRNEIRVEKSGSNKAPMRSHHIKSCDSIQLGHDLENFCIKVKALATSKQKDPTNTFIW